MGIEPGRGSEYIEAQECELSSRIDRIEEGLGAGEISLRDIFGSSIMFRALQPGINPE